MLAALKGGWRVGVSQKTAPTSGGIPIDAMDHGDGYYITQDVEPIGELRYCSCGPNGQKQFSNDLWQAEIYIQHMKNDRW